MKADGHASRADSTLSKEMTIEALKGHGKETELYKGQQSIVDYLCYVQQGKSTKGILKHEYTHSSDLDSSWITSRYNRTNTLCTSCRIAISLHFFHPRNATRRLMVTCRTGAIYLKLCPSILSSLLSLPETLFTMPFSSSNPMFGIAKMMGFTDSDLTRTATRAGQRPTFVTFAPNDDGAYLHDVFFEREFLPFPSLIRETRCPMSDRPRHVQETRRSRWTHSILGVLSCGFFSSSNLYVELKRDPFGSI